MKYVPGKGWVPSTPAEVSAARSFAANAPTKRPRGRPKGSGGKKYERRLTPEQLERLKEIQRINGRAQGLSRKGTHHKNNPAPDEERVVFKMLRSTRDTIQRCAIRDNKTMVMFLDDFAKMLRADPYYADLFAEEAENNDNTNQQEEQS